MSIPALALLAATATAVQDPEPPLGERIAECLAKARPSLLRWIERTRGEPLPLLVLAALHDGVQPDDRALARGIARLAKTEIDSTYGLALRLMVLAECPDFPDLERIAARDTELLLTRQNGGGFSYGPHDGWWDLSNTQYAALGLRAAVSLGQEIDPLVWRALLNDVLAGQKDNGAFTYRPSQGRPSANPSMTVAGIAVVEICRQHLRLDQHADDAAARAVERGWEWLAENARSIGDRRVRATLYYHYGLERAAILSGKERVGDVDWYAAGAEMLLDMQRRSGLFFSKNEVRGGFQGERVRRGDAVDTAFAVLFLRRAFARTLAPRTGSPRTLALGAQARQDEIDRAVAHDRRLGWAAVPELIAAMRAPLAVRRRAAAAVVAAFAGQDFGFDPARDAEANAEALRRAEQWWLYEGKAKVGAGR